MASNTTNMTLAIWDQPTDHFDYINLYQNFTKIDAHDHTTGKGAQIPEGGIANGAVTQGKLASGAVGASQIQSNAISSSKIADNAVETAKIANSAVDASKLGDSAVIEAKIGTGAVTNGKLASDSVTTAKILDSNVTAAKIADGVITGGAAGTGVKIAATTITADNLASNSVTADKILNQTITRNKLASGITGNMLASTSVPAGLGSSDDGYIINYVDTSANPSYVWQLRWNGLSSRWDFIGGTPYVAETTSSGSFTGSATYGALGSSASQSILLPSAFTGDCAWAVEISGTGQATATYTGSATASMSFNIVKSAGNGAGTTAANDANRWAQYAPYAATNYIQFSGYKKSIITGNDLDGATLTCHFKSTLAASGSAGPNLTILKHAIQVTPVYLS